MDNDNTIYAGMTSTPLTDAELKTVSELTKAWAEVTPDDVTVRLVFYACINVLVAMGPAYRKLAAVNLARSDI